MRDDADAWTLYDADTLALRWTRPASDLTASPVMWDANSDGTLDLVMAGWDEYAPWAMVVLDPQTGALRDTIRAPREPIAPAGLVPWDADGDGDLELAVGGYIGSALYSAEQGWGRIPHVLSEGFAVFPADIAPTPGDELVVVASGTYDDGWRISVIDPVTGARRADSAGPRARVTAWNPAGMGADTDGDGTDEVHIFSVRGQVTAFDRNHPGHPLTWSTGGDHPVVADVDGDGRDEVLSSAPGGVQLVDLAGQRWLSTAASYEVLDLAAGDIDGDGLPEAIALSPRGVDALDGRTGGWRGSVSGRWESLDISPIPGGSRLWLTQALAHGPATVTVEALDLTTMGVVPAGSWQVTFAQSSYLRAFDGLIFVYGGYGVRMLDTHTGLEVVLGTAAADVGYAVHPIPGGFVVAHANGVTAFARP